jgi:pimeloyl-ACP methyl ester carboxylesterase
VLQDVSFTAEARMIAEVIDALGIERIDLIGNDSGGAVAQIFAALFPDRLSSLVLTNCDVHDGWPPPQVPPLMEPAKNGTLASVFQPMIDRPDLARERFSNGESVPLFRSYADPSILTDEIIRLYLQPPLSSPQRLEAFQRYWLGFDNAQTVAIHSALKTLRVPTLIVWGLQDMFFDKTWACRLKNTIPGARRVVEIEDARLFLPEDRPDALATPVLQFWDELQKRWSPMSAPKYQEAAIAARSGPRIRRCGCGRPDFPHNARRRLRHRSWSIRPAPRTARSAPGNRRRCRHAALRSRRRADNRARCASARARAPLRARLNLVLPYSL